MCLTGFEKVSDKDASIRLWKSSPRKLSRNVALLVRACANLVSIPRALKKLYGATLKRFTSLFDIKEQGASIRSHDGILSILVGFPGKRSDTQFLVKGNNRTGCSVH